MAKSKKPIAARSRLGSLARRTPTPPGSPPHGLADRRKPYFTLFARVLLTPPRPRLEAGRRARVRHIVRGSRGRADAVPAWKRDLDCACSNLNGGVGKDANAISLHVQMESMTKNISPGERDDAVPAPLLVKTGISAKVIGWDFVHLSWYIDTSLQISRPAKQNCASWTLDPRYRV